MEGLTAGRIVHYVMRGRSNLALEDHITGEHRPAIVVRVWNPDDNIGTVQLHVFPDGLNDGFAASNGGATFWATSVIFDEEEKKPGTWHWIERA